jgi:hypothetical protein
MPPYLLVLIFAFRNAGTSLNNRIVVTCQSYLHGLTSQLSRPLADFSIGGSAPGPTRHDHSFHHHFILLFCASPALISSFSCVTTRRDKDRIQSREVGAAQTVEMQETDLIQWWTFEADGILRGLPSRRLLLSDLTTIVMGTEKYYLTET